MKKTFLGFAVAAVLMVACNNAENKSTTTGDSAVNESIEHEVAKAPSTDVHTHGDVPKFSSPEIQQLADSYATFYHDYAEAVKSKDVAKLQAYATDAGSWATKAQEAMSKMTAEDVEKWTQWSQKVASELQAASTGK